MSKIIKVDAEKLRELYRAYNKIYGRFDTKFYDMGIKDSHDFIMKAMTNEFEELFIDMLGVKVNNKTISDLPDILHGKGAIDDMPANYDYNIHEYVKGWSGIKDCPNGCGNIHLNSTREYLECTKCHFIEHLNK